MVKIDPEKLKKWHKAQVWTAEMVEEAYKKKRITKKQRDNILASK